MMLAESNNLAVNSFVKNELQLTKTSRFLFYAFAIYLVLPLVDIPLLGLSFSAIFIALVALEVFFRNHEIKIRHYRLWIVLIYFLWLGFTLSLLVNSILGTLSIGSTQFMQIIRATFWIIAFLTTIIVVSNVPSNQIKTIVLLLAVSIICLGVIRLSEAILFDRWGPSTARILSQNNYGILFSRFTPFAFALPLWLSKRWSLVSVVGIVILLLAIVVNGSRSSWISVTIGIVVFFFLYGVTKPKHLQWILILVSFLSVLLTSIFIYLPSEALETISYRYATLEQLEEDKSFVTRQLMWQKSILLFERNPIFGAGLGEFNRTSVDLVIPYILSGSTRDFNTIAAHNSYAKLLGETGLVGIIPFAILLLILFYKGLFITYQYARDGEFWAIAVYAAFIGMSVHQWAIDNLGNTSPWFVYGLVAALIVRYKPKGKHNAA